MYPIAVRNLSSRYENGVVSMSWKLPSESPDTIFICPVDRGSVDKVERWRVRDHASGVTFKPSSVSGDSVTRREYIVFLEQGNAVTLKKDEALLRDLGFLIGDRNFAITQIIGRANIEYRLKATRLGEGFSKNIIQLKSDVPIEEGILGYTFWADGRMYTVPFPGAVLSGKSDYAPFYSDDGGEVKVVPIEDDSLNNIVIKQGKSLLSRFI